MIDWEKYAVQPTEETLKDYPTMLDILKDVVGQEEEMQIHKHPLNREKTDFFYDLFRPGHSLLMRDDVQKMPVLMPTGKTPFTFYRGQSKYHEKCLPSLYRYEEDELRKETLRSHLQTAEMIMLMKSHPVIMALERGGIINDKLGFIRLPIMYDGLAQHYGIKTCYLDLTNDIWCAAFFAATTYDGEYHPKVVTEDMQLEEKYGVLYKLDYSRRDRNQDFSKDYILPIGLQYFNRPGKQSALVIAMQDMKDLHKMSRLERVYFRHDTEVSKLIYTLSQFGSQFITDDPLAKLVERICHQDRYWIESVNLAQRIYYPDRTVDSIKDEMAGYGFEITENMSVSFPEEQIAKEFDDWTHGGLQRYIDGIIIQPVTTMKID